MDSIPVEILHKILCFFCFHCQHPGVFPHADTEEVRRDKKTLARMCRVSKTICATAQPVLYHYYATGNLSVETELYEEDERDIKHPLEPDLMPQFLRTIIDRPDLASRITTMQVVNGESSMGYFDHALTINSLVETSASKNLLAKPPRGEWTSQLPDDCPIFLRRWLVTLAMVLAPRLESMLLALEHDAEFLALKESPHVRLPSLRTLALMGHESDYHFTELEALYAAAPNLETIYACDAAGWSIHNAEFHMHDYEYDLSLPNLRKLVISDLIAGNLGNSLLCLPKLEDLEYYWQEGSHEFHLQGLLDMVKLLQPVRKTLKRLCLSYLPPNWSGPGEPAWLHFPSLDYPPIGTLRDFDRLEHLSIDHRSISREGDRDMADLLVSRLPESIRSLRISYVYKSMENSLSQLALDAPADFTLLKKVEIGIAEVTKPWYLNEIVQMRGFWRDVCAVRFEAAGISLTWRADRFGPHPRTMIPGASVGSRLVSLPGY